MDLSHHPIDEKELRARADVAIRYSRLGRAGIARRLGTSVSTLNRKLAGTGSMTLGDALEIARATAGTEHEVPEDFIRGGFDACRLNGALRQLVEEEASRLLLGQRSGPPPSEVS